MASFEKAMERIFEYEVGDDPNGGYTNDPHDYGGETKWGISKRAHPEVNIKDLTKMQALEIYRRDYWNKIGGDFLKDQGLAEELMDIAVNLHWTAAIRWAQHSLNELHEAEADGDEGLVEDGLFGPKTIEALNGYERPRLLVKMLNGYQFAHYIKRCDDDPTQRKFMRSWLRRVEFRET